MIAYVVQLTNGYLERQYGIGIKGQGQIYLKSVYGLFCKFLFHCLTEGVPFQHNEARFFFLLIYEEISSDLGSGGTKKINKKALKMTC